MALVEKKVIKEGYEKVVEILENAIEEIETAKNQEIDALIKEVEDKYANRLNDYKNDLDRYVHFETIEVFDEPLINEVETENVVVEEKNELGE